MTLATQAEPGALRLSAPTESMEAAARRLARQSLKACAANRDTLARGPVGLSLLFASLVSDLNEPLINFRRLIELYIVERGFDCTAVQSGPLSSPR